jgi:hypothetical protein
MPRAIPIAELESSIPTTLDDVIKRKDVMRLQLATDSDLAALALRVPEGVVKMTLRDWYVVMSVHGTTKKRIALTLFGTAGEAGGTANTSALVARQGDRFLTSSGAIYECVGPTSSEPDLLHICAWLNYLGIGEALGVAPFFL